MESDLWFLCYPISEKNHNDFASGKIRSVSKQEALLRKMAEGGGKSLDAAPSFERQNTDEIEDLPLKIPVSVVYVFSK